DNQPDFTWIAPHETKIFDNFWYNVKEIGEVKRSTEKGAINLEKTDNGAFIGYYSTSKGKFIVTLTAGGKTIYTDKTEISPEKPFTATVDFDGDFNDLCVTVKRGNETVIEYSPIVKQGKTDRTPQARAQAVRDFVRRRTLDSRTHLRQYKHFAYSPEDYFLEALRRDKNDIRCNQAMGDLCYDRGMFEEAIAYYTTALDRQRLRNANPDDTSAFYRRALCKFRLGDEKGAFDDAYSAVWSYANRTAAYYLLAKIASKRGDKSQAVDFLRLALETNVRDLRARYALAILPATTRRQRI
ncbi:MAG: tetratricopeptide repeat protein, partial [Christensenellales bacterium]